MSLPNPPEYENPHADPFLSNIAELRHLYKNLVREGKEEMARGLLSPRIQFFTKYWEEKQRAERTEEERRLKAQEEWERQVRADIEEAEIWNEHY